MPRLEDRLKRPFRGERRTPTIFAKGTRADLRGTIMPFEGVVVILKVIAAARRSGDPRPRPLGCHPEMEYYPS